MPAPRPSDSTIDTAPAARRSFCPPQGRRFVMASAILASSMGFIDGSVVSLAMPIIRTDLGATLVDAQWISNGYMLFLAALVLLGGVAGDVFGVRNIFAGGIAVFMVTSLLCALSIDAETLIVMRAAQGIGAAFMVPGSLAIIAKSYPADIRGAAIGKWAAYSSLTTAMGPFIGGLVLSLGEPWMWRMIFAINVPIGIVALAMLLMRVPADRPSAKRRLDMPGAVLATVSLGILAWGMTSFGLPSEGRLIGPGAWLLIGALLFAGFVLWESQTRAPMVKLQLFRSRIFAGANLYTLFLFFAFNAVLFFLPMTVITGWGAKEWQASLLFIPLSLFIALLSGFSGRLSDRWGPRLPLTVGAGIMAVSYALLALTMPLMRLWEVTFPVLLLNGLGMAVVVSPLSAAVMLAVSDDDTGLASGVNNAVARAAGLMAVAALGAVAGLVFSGVLGAPVAGVEFGAAPQSVLAPVIETLRVEATNRAFQAIAWAAAALSAASVVVAWITQPSWTDRKS